MSAAAAGFVAHGATHPAPLDIPALVGAAGWARLCPAIRRRFAPGHAADAPVYRGSLALDRSAIGAVFALFALILGAPLPLRRARDAPAEVRVREDGAGGVVWERWLQLAPGRTHCIRSTKRLGADGTLLECTEGGLGMVLAVFEAEGALVFESRAYVLDLFGGGWRIPLPALLTPGRCCVAHSAGEGSENRFRFTMDMTHPLWGRCFHQTGVFEDPAPLPIAR